MAVSIADMERVALGGDSLRFDDDIGNIIELGDLAADDHLGLGMLANTNMSVNKASENSGRTVRVDPFQSSNNSSSSSSFGLSDIKPLEPLEPISLGEVDVSPIDIPFNTGPSRGPEITIQKDNSPYSNPYSNYQSNSSGGIQLSTSSKDPEAEKKEKADYINKLNRLEQKGFPVSRKFTMDNALTEIKDEYFRLVDARNLETSIKFQRQMLMGAITGLEWLNGRFDPFDLKLDGWSESVHENVEDFDEIFEELYDKYKDKGKMSPEMRLIMAVGGSGFMCHVSNSFFKSKMPSMDEVLKRNPELARQMAAAAAQQAGPGFGNFMGMAMGVQQPQAFSGNGGPGPMGPNPSINPQTSQAGAFYSAGGMTPQSPMTPPVNQTARREMKGPSGVEDILQTFEEVRRAEMTQTMEPTTGFTMQANQPAVHAVMSGTASVVTADDIMSQAESSRTGATAGGRRKRKTTLAPVGNTVVLDA